MAQASPVDDREAQHYTKVDDWFFDELMPRLSPAEFKVAAYVLRRTSGFNRRSDAISLSQMAAGIVRADGRRLDGGTGESLSTVKRAVAGLVEKRVLLVQRRRAPSGGNGVNLYSLVPSVQTEPTPSVRYDPTPGSKSTRPLGPNRPTQKTGGKTERNTGTGEGSPTQAGLPLVVGVKSRMNYVLLWRVAVADVKAETADNPGWSVWLDRCRPRMLTADGVLVVDADATTADYVDGRKTRRRWPGDESFDLPAAIERALTQHAGRPIVVEAK